MLSKVLGEIVKPFTLSLSPFLSLSLYLALPCTPGKYKIYLSSQEVDNIRLHRGHTDTGQNIYRCTADTGSLSVCLGNLQSNKHKNTMHKTHTRAPTGANLGQVAAGVICTAVVILWNSSMYTLR